ncbi:MAG: hypothetical protein IPI29_04050 [Ignavibacteria bacterium]|nr:hypothetical protein [Ignavibacteria bacterium]
MASQSLLSRLWGGIVIGSMFIGVVLLWAFVMFGSSAFDIFFIYALLKDDNSFRKEAIVAYTKSDYPSAVSFANRALEEEMDDQQMRWIKLFSQLNSNDGRFDVRVGEFDESDSMYMSVHLILLADSSRSNVIPSQAVINSARHWYRHSVMPEDRSIACCIIASEISEAVNDEAKQYQKAGVLTLSPKDVEVIAKESHRLYAKAHAEAPNSMRPILALMSHYALISNEDGDAQELDELGQKAKRILGRPSLLHLYFRTLFKLRHRDSSALSDWPVEYSMASPQNCIDAASIESALNGELTALELGSIGVDWYKTLALYYREQLATEDRFAIHKYVVE